MTGLLVGYSLLIAALAWVLDIHRLEGDFEGYWERPNWLLFALFFPLLVALVVVSWDPFLLAWRDLCRNGCIRQRQDAPARVTATEIAEVICRHLGRWRRVVLAGAGFLTALVMLETGNLREVYRANKVQMRQALGLAGRTAQVRIVGTLSFPPLSARLDVESSSRPRGGLVTLVTPGARGALVREKDWTVAYLLDREDGSDWISRPANGAFVLAAYVQQLAAIWLGWLGLGQILLHIFAFWSFERLSIARKLGLVLRLDPRSRLREFGLEAWNHALNNLYWVLGLALLVPLLSRFSQSSQPDAGQQLIRFIVPSIVVLPMLLTIIASPTYSPGLERNGANGGRCSGSRPRGPEATLNRSSRTRRERNAADAASRAVAAEAW